MAITNHEDVCFNEKGAGEARYRHNWERKLSNALDFIGLTRARLHRREIVADNARHLRPDGLGFGGIAARLLLDHPFQQALHEGHAARLDRLQVVGREERWSARVPAVAAVCEQRLDRGDDLARRRPGEGDAVGARASAFSTPTMRKSRKSPHSISSRMPILDSVRRVSSPLPMIFVSYAGPGPTGFSRSAVRLLRRWLGC